MKKLSSIATAVATLKKGGMILLVDDPSRENEGDLFMLADTATPAKVNFMVTHGRGLVCVAIERAQARRLTLPLMVASHENTETTRVNFGVSVNAARGIDSGISAHDRAKTIRVLASPGSKAKDITRPGHVFPLIAHDGGLRARQGHTEAAVALAKLAGANPAGVLCEVLRKDGRMARMPELLKMGEEFGLPVVAISDLIRYVRLHPIPHATPPCIVREASAKLPTSYGKFDIHIYHSPLDKREHAALVLGSPTTPVLTRVHSKCVTGDTLGSLTCDCGEQLRASLAAIEREGSGVLLYLDQEGRGIGLVNKIRAYAHQERGLDTMQANRALGFAPDLREYGIAADMLRDLGITNIALLTNNPEKIKGLRAHGIKVTKRVPLETVPHAVNRHYLSTKKKKFGHKLISV
ncbi:MAG: GTP cyclohydrolase II [bacterium]|nr:GTP cyclohydrolase II [bacterium]